MSKDPAPSTTVGRRILLLAFGLAGASCADVSPAGLTGAAGPAVAVSPQEVRFDALGATHLLTATVDRNAATGVLTWESLDPSVAEVRQGEVEAIGPGSTIVTAAVGVAVDTALIVVEPVPVALRIDEDGPIRLSYLGQARKLSANILDRLGSPIEAHVTWSSADPTVVVLEPTGVARATGTGTVTVVAVSDELQDSVAIEVVQKPGRINLRPDSVRVAPNAPVVEFIVDVSDVGGSPTNRPVVEWAMVGDSNAVVLSHGAARAVAPGVVGVIARTGSLADTSWIVVRNRRIAATPAVALFSALHDTLSLSATMLIDGEGAPPPADLEWRSLNTGVVSVDGRGLATALSAGSTFIVAAAAGCISDSVAITVEPEVVAVEIEPSFVTLEVDSGLTMVAVPRDARGHALVAPVSWASRNGAVVTVSESGRSTGVAEGAAWVVASVGRVADSVLVSVESGRPGGFFVSPDGGTAGTGAFHNPWDLRTALAQPPDVAPGDTIWIRGGTYDGDFESQLYGRSNSPVVLRALPGERVILNGTLTIRGHDAWYWGLEITNSGPNRTGARPPGVVVLGPRTRLINLVVHDVGVGIGLWSAAIDSEVSGSLIFNNGWQGPSRGHGHGIYSQNALPSLKQLRSNVIVQNFGFGVHVYTEGGSIEGFRMDGNVVSSRFLVGGLQPVNDVEVTGNHVWGQPIEMGYSASVQNGSAMLSGNVQSEPTAVRGSWTSLQETLTLDGDTLNATFVWPNEYESGRGTVVIYNAGGSGSVSVNLASLGLQMGDEYRLVQAQNPLEEGIDFVYEGRSISVPMNGWTVGPPKGWGPLAESTFPRFGVFLVRPAYEDGS